MAHSLPKLGLTTATLLVVANMIGTGIFALAGVVQSSLVSPEQVMVAWLLGGLFSLFGALAYGELAAWFPRSGGEYHFLRELYHPALGFLAGFVSLIAGFAAAIASSALAFGEHLFQLMPGVQAQLVALGQGAGLDVLSAGYPARLGAILAGAVLVVLLTTLHLLSVQGGARTQNIFTIVKVLLLLGLVLAGFVVPALPAPATSASGPGFFSTGFATALIPVFYAYLGWNAAVYITSEVEHPQRTIPRALFLGTLIVTALYGLFTWAVLRHVPTDSLTDGQQYVAGSLLARAVFGETGGAFFTGFIGLALVSSVSAMIMAGPRVTHVMGEDYPAFAGLGRRNAAGAPKPALLLQMGLTLLLMVFFTLLEIVEYMGFTLSLFNFLCVAGLFWQRYRQPELVATLPYRTPGYPVLPLLFLALLSWVLFDFMASNPYISLAGLGTLVVGLVLHGLLRTQP